MRLLMAMPRTANGVARMMEAIFGDIPVFLVGAFAAWTFHDANAGALIAIAREQSTSNADERRVQQHPS